MTTEDFYAPARLGFSMFIAHTFDEHHEKIYVLVSRVLEKTSIYAHACLLRVYELAGLHRYRHCVQWTDGPRQFKSLEMLGSSLPIMQTRLVLLSMRFEFGCPCHWKGRWDAAGGSLNSALDAEAATRRINDMERVVTVLGDWGRRQEAMKVDGTQWHVEFFMPKPKSQYQRECYTSASVGGTWMNQLNKRLLIGALMHQTIIHESMITEQIKPITYKSMTEARYRRSLLLVVHQERQEAAPQPPRNRRSLQRGEGLGLQGPQTHWPASPREGHHLALRRCCQGL